MGLFSRRSRRAQRKAQAKALERKAALEAKLGARNQRRRNRAELRTQRDVAQQQIATLKAQEKAALKAVAKADRVAFSTGHIRRYLGVARVLVPVLAPLLYRAATLLRGQLDSRRARQLGVEVDQLGNFPGHGARLHVRIESTESALSEIEKKTGTGKSRSSGDGETRKFVSTTRDRLHSLSAAIRTADQMPTGRRRAVHSSISHELTGIEADVLARLGVH